MTAEVVALRDRWASPTTATVSGALVIAPVLGAVLLGGLTHHGITYDLSSLAGFSTFAAVGVVVGRHQPRNPVGWVLLVSRFPRTLSHVAVTGLVVGVYAGVVTLTTRVLGFSSPVAVAAPTLAAAALFNTSGIACSASSIMAPTAPGTTHRRSSQGSPHACGMRSISTRFRVTS